MIEKIKDLIENFTDQSDGWYENFAGQIPKWFQPVVILSAAIRNCIKQEVTSLGFFLK